MSDNGEEIKPEEKPEDKPEAKEPQPEATDFKLAEVWIRSGKIMLDAPPNFWSDRCRALGVLEYCKDIVKTAQMKEEPNKIIPVKGSMINGIRGLFKHRRN